MVYPAYKLPFEELTSIDERVDYIHNQLVASQLALNQLLEREGIPTMAEVTREVPLKATVAALEGTKIQKPSPLTGRITQVVRHWPEGCSAYVDVAFGHGDVWVLPSEADTFVALDDATPVIAVSEPVTKGEMLWMVIRNGDSANPHTISVTATIIGAE